MNPRFRFLPPLKPSAIFFLLAAGVLRADPVLEVSLGDAVFVSGGTLDLANPGSGLLSDERQFLAPDAPLAVSFGNISPGLCTLETSFDGGEEGFWSAVPPTIAHPAPGTVVFTDTPLPVVQVFYRLRRQIFETETLTLRNAGDMPLTSLAAALSGAAAGDFSLDTSFTATTLDPGETTTVDVTFTFTGAGTREAVLSFSGTGLPAFALNLRGDNAPTLIQSVVSKPLELESFILTPASPTTPVRFTGTFSGSPHAVVIVEGSRDLGAPLPWSEITRITLDASGTGSIANAEAADSIGVTRYFVRSRFAE